VRMKRKTARGQEAVGPNPSPRFGQGRLSLNDTLARRHQNK
jgi:hypothetical protein